MDLIKPADNLKFELIDDVYKNSLNFELGKVHTKNSFNIVGNKVFNFGILRTEKNKRTSRKRRMNLEIIDTICILGIQNNDVNFLNPVTISISWDTVIQKLTKYKRCRYRFLLESLLFSSNVKNDTDVILISCDGLSDSKQALINSRLTSLLGVCYLNKLKDWEFVKGQPKRSQAIFRDSEIIRNSSHFAFAFTTRNVFDLLNFTVILLDGNGKEIKFPTNEKKLPIINFKFKSLKIANDLKDIIKDFKNLASKIQTDNSNVKQHLKDKNLMLEACQKEYQKIYFEHENLKKIYQQLEEQLKQQQQQQQQLIKKLPWHMKNKKRYFINDDSEDENIDDYENENDDYDDDNNEVEYIKVKKNKNKKKRSAAKKIKQKKHKKEQ